MMKKEFIPYEQALVLKELGLEVDFSFGHYNYNTCKMRDYICERVTKSFFPAPLYQQAFRWFREKYGYFQLFDYQHGDSKKNIGYFFNIVNIKDSDFFFPEDFKVEIYKTYEEAELECLKKLIEIVKQK